MSDTTIYGWSGLDLAGKRIFIRGAQVEETALTGVLTYDDVASFEAAHVTSEMALIPFASLQAAKAAQISEACATIIRGGYTSAALGAPNVYGSAMTDQANLDSDAMAAATDPTTTATITCSADTGATWVAQVHSAAQIATLWKDFRAFRIAAQAKNRTFQAAVAAATTPDALTAIAWA